MQEKKIRKELTKKMMRHILGSIDLTDVDKLRVTEEEAKNRAGDVEVFYKKHFKKVIKLLIQQQLEFLGKNANYWEMVIWAQGTLNGLKIVDEWFTDQVKLSLARFDKKKGDNPLGNLDDLDI